MKKIIIISLLLFAGVTISSATPIPLSVGFDDTSGTMPGHPKSPPCVPVIDQEGYSVDFGNSHPGYTLQLLDENDLLVYSVYVPSSQTTVALPTWLSGSYELRLYPDDSYIYFYGTVEF